MSENSRKACGAASQVAPAEARMGKTNWQDRPVNALQLLLIGLAGWLNRNQQLIIEYLQEEVNVLREQLATVHR
jgi:hypothetical protein